MGWVWLVGLVGGMGLVGGFGWWVWLVGGCGGVGVGGGEGEERRGGGGGDGWIVGVMGMGRGRGNGEMEEKGGWGLVEREKGKGKVHSRQTTLSLGFLGYILASIYELSTTEREDRRRIHTYSRYSPPPKKREKREKNLQIPWFGRTFCKNISFVSLLCKKNRLLTAVASWSVCVSQIPSDFFNKLKN